MRTALLWMTIAASLCMAAVNPMEQDTLELYLEKGAPFDLLIIDVRNAEETATVVGNAAYKPYNLAWPAQFKEEVAKIPKDAAIIVYCRSGSRSRQAAAYLSDSGYTRVYDAGGFMTWHGPTVSGLDVKPASALPEPSVRVRQAMTTSSGGTHASKN